MGADVEMPDETAIRVQFDEYLRMPPKNEQSKDPQRYALMQGLGLRP